MRTIEYYEYISADICKLTNVEDIWKKTRKIENVKARQFCMMYRNKYLKMSLSIAGERYCKDHATIYRAIKTIDNLVETKDYWGEKYLLFLNKCLEHERLMNKPLLTLSNRIAEIGWQPYIDELKDKFHYLINLVEMAADEIDVRKNIDVCTEKLNELKMLYE